MGEQPLVINACHGGFGLSMEAERAYLDRKGKQAFFYTNARTSEGRTDFDRNVRAEDANHQSFVTYTLTEDLGPTPSSDALNASKAWFTERDIPRDDPDLIAVVREMGPAASGRHASLSIVSIPADTEWEIEEYDGLEWVAEKHRTWS